jgi:crotonobetainyl-CoA:carnitine CoA-transferase CaiB-like acyl-CoA transferase
MLLGDLGADVIKLERPIEGDETRGWGPPFDPHGQSAYYISINRNKLSVAVDYDRPADRALVLDLLAEADVVVDNFRHGTLERRGIEPDRLLQQYPRMVWCSISGFGAGNPRPGYDFVTQAECGWMAITGEPDGSPMKSGVALADVIAGKDAAIAILAALVAVGRSSAEAPSSGAPSRRIVISLVDSARAALVNVAQNTLLSGRDASRWGNAHPNLVPYQLFRARDRGVVIAVGSDTQWRQCARALELPDLADDPSLATNAGRLAARDRIAGAFAAAVSREPASVIQERLDAAGVPNGVVKTVLETLRETDASAATGVPSSVGGKVRRPPPRLDEHGEDVRRLRGRGEDGRGRREHDLTPRFTCSCSLPPPPSLPPCYRESPGIVIPTWRPKSCAAHGRTHCPSHEKWVTLSS